MISRFLQRLWPNPRVLLAFALVLPLIAIGAFPARAAGLPSVKVDVDISTQIVRVYVGDMRQPVHTWKTSTATSRHTDCTYGACRTPVGTFGVTAIHEMWYAAAKFKSVPMPHTVFWDNAGDGFHAAVGQKELDMLGQEDSHGCARLLPDAAAELYGLVKQHEVFTGRHDRWGHPVYVYPGVTIFIHGQSNDSAQIVRT